MGQDGSSGGLEMKLEMKSFATAALLVIAGANVGHATTVTNVCPDEDGFSRTFTLTTNVGNSCYAWGDTNVIGNNSDGTLSGGGDFTNFEDYLASLDPSRVLLSKIDGSSDGLYSELLNTESMNNLLGGTGGEFVLNLTESVLAAFNLASIDNALLAFKTGSGTDTPSWAAFKLSELGEISGSWSVNTKQDLSNISLWGTPTVIPLPAAGWLLLAGLGSLALLRRRRKDA